MQWPPLPDLVDSLRTGDRTPTDVVGTALDRIQAVDDDLGAFVSLNGAAMERAEALEAQDPASNPLHGLPVAVKDNQATQDLPTTHGSTLLEDHVPGADHPVVERLREAGAVVVGKTNLAPFALLAITNNDLRGPTRNPWNRSRSPGGSSGGSAAAVAAGLVPAATGTDGGGSIRIPASWCGVVGHKPSRGRLPDAGGLPTFHDLSVPGVLTRTVAGTALLLDVVAGPHPRDPDALPAPETPYRQAVDEAGLEGTSVAATTFDRPVDAGIEAAFEDGLEALEEAGADVRRVEADLPDEEEAMVTKTAAEARAYLDEAHPDWEEELWPPLAAMAGGAEATGTAEYIRARDAGERLWSALRPLYEDHDLVSTPVTAVPPFPAEAIGPEDVGGEAAGPLGWMPFTFPLNFTGQPAASVPAARHDDGSPAGLHLVGPPRADREVLTAVAAVEAVVDEASRWPDEMG